MQLSTRLWLSGAVLPALVMGAVLFGAERWFQFGLERSLDQALLAQAAVESVSLFDGPDRRPHLHMASSPLVESVRAFAPEGVLFGPDGHEVMRYPPATKLRARGELLLPATPGTPPVLVTSENAGVRERSLTVTVLAPTGEPYALRLTAAMSQVDAALAISQRLLLAALLVATLALALFQGFQGRALKRRLGELSAHVEALRKGNLDRSLPLEATHDELSAFRQVLSQATFALKQARDGKERLLADAAHELRTPLTLMRTSLDLALRRERPVQELKAALEDARVEVNRLASLASRLLDSAALAHQSEDRVRCDVAALVHAAVEQVRAECEVRELSLTTHLPPALSADVRPHALRQAVDNLLSNAMKFARAAFAIRASLADDVLTIEVTDDGPGIPASERELVFEPFHRLQHAEAGAGLGLAIVREVALSHEGRAFVRPSDRGAELVLELRVAPTS